MDDAQKGQKLAEEISQFCAKLAHKLKVPAVMLNIVLDTKKTLVFLGTDDGQIDEAETADALAGAAVAMKKMSNDIKEGKLRPKECGDHLKECHFALAPAEFNALLQTLDEKEAEAKQEKETKKKPPSIYPPLDLSGDDAVSFSN